MYELDQTVKKLVLVCANKRQDGRECCGEKGAEAIRQKLKHALALVNPQIRVSKAGCLDRCSTGVTVVIMPDNIWLGRVQEHDISELVKRITSSL
jgi:(2Fe-2S) ferredoxin